MRGRQRSYIDHQPLTPGRSYIGQPDMQCTNSQTSAASQAQQQTDDWSRAAEMEEQTYATSTVPTSIVPTRYRFARNNVIRSPERQYGQPAAAVQSAAAAQPSASQSIVNRVHTTTSVFEGPQLPRSGIDVRPAVEPMGMHPALRPTGVVPRGFGEEKQIARDEGQRSRTMIDHPRPVPWSGSGAELQRSASVVDTQPLLNAAEVQRPSSTLERSNAVSHKASKEHIVAATETSVHSSVQTQQDHINVVSRPDAKTERKPSIKLKPFGNRLRRRGSVAASQVLAIFRGDQEKEKKKAEEKAETQDEQLTEMEKWQKMCYEFNHKIYQDPFQSVIEDAFDEVYHDLRGEGTFLKYDDPAPRAEEPSALDLEMQKTWVGDTLVDPEEVEIESLLRQEMWRAHREKEDVIEETYEPVTGSAIRYDPTSTSPRVSIHIEYPVPRLPPPQTVASEDNTDELEKGTTRPVAEGTVQVDEVDRAVTPEDGMDEIEETTHPVAEGTVQIDEADEAVPPEPVFYDALDSTPSPTEVSQSLGAEAPIIDELGSTPSSTQASQSSVAEATVNETPASTPSPTHVSQSSVAEATVNDELASAPSPTQASQSLVAEATVNDQRSRPPSGSKLPVRVARQSESPPIPTSSSPTVNRRDSPQQPRVSPRNRSEVRDLGNSGRGERYPKRKPWR